MFTRNYWHGVLTSMVVYDYNTYDTLVDVNGNIISENRWSNFTGSTTGYSENTYFAVWLDDYLPSLYNSYYSEGNGRGCKININCINSGSAIYYQNSSGTTLSTTDSYLTNYVGVVLGDGNVTPTFDDYKLSGSRITNFTAIVHLINSCVDGKLTLQAVYDITNTGTTAYTVREIGIYLPYRQKSTTFLIEHTLLETPVTIQPGESAPISYTLQVL